MIKKRIARQQTGQRLDGKQFGQTIVKPHDTLPQPNNQLAKRRASLLVRKRIPRHKEVDTPPMQQATNATIATTDSLEGRITRGLFVRMGVLENLSLPGTPYLVDDLLRGGLVVIAGPGKLGKTSFTLRMCLSLARSDNFLGFSVSEKRKVAYLSLENSPADIRNYAVKQGFTKSDNVEVSFPRFESVEQGLDYITQIVHSGKVDLVVIDSLETFCPVLDHNDSKQVKPLLQGFRDILKGTSISIIVIDHLNKLGFTNSNNPFTSLRGSVSKISGTDAVVILREGDKQDQVLLTIRGYQPPKQMIIKREPRTFSWTLVAEDTSKLPASQEEENLLNAIKRLGESSTNKNLSNSLGMKPYEISRATDKLLDRGLIVEIGSGKGKYYQVRTP